MKRIAHKLVAASAWLAITGCGGSDGAPAVDALTGPIAAVVPTPSPTQTSSADSSTGSLSIASASLEGGSALHAAFSIQNGLQPSWGTGAIPGLYNQYEGAFRFTCGGAIKVVNDDPLVYPNEPGKSHLHQPWGNASFDASTTSASLSKSAETDCNDTPYSLNRSAYWMPALINDQGQAIHPDLVSVYYKRKTSTSPFCTQNSGSTMGICIGLPNQIRFVFGWNMNDPTAPVQGASWYCTKGDGKHYGDLDALFNSGCVAGAQIIANTIAPNCWDGKHLDVADHRSHMAYGSYGSWGYYKCPADHPYVIPQEENKATFTVTDDMIGTNPDGTHFSRIRLSSDAMLAGAKPGQTLHADYIESWVAEAKDLWLANCIEKALDCSGGDLGNGQQLIGAAKPSYGWINPHPREAVPAAPSAG